MLSPLTAYKIVRDLGPEWALARLRFSLERRFGALERRLPAHQWRANHNPGAVSLGRDFLNASRFFFPTGCPPKFSSSRAALEQADRVLAGEWPYFSHLWISTGFAPEWHLNPLTGVRADSNAHWSAINLDALGDVKLIWEASRFAPAFLLARAYTSSGDERYAEGFWRLFEDWMTANPPNTGVNWACGQEASFRVIAWCFGVFAFAAHPASTRERIDALIEAVSEHGQRIAGHIDYAVSQRNNHGISEATGLFTIGVLFPQLPMATEWRQRGQELITEQLRQQIYPDGSYVQHSFNYQRLMIDLMLWAFRLAEINDCRFSDECYRLLGRATHFMLRFCNTQSGAMPNYGGNDGALLLPLSACDYQDYRPTLQAAYYLVHRTFCFAEGPWDETAEWLFGAELRDSLPARITNSMSENSGTTGYLKLSTREGDAMLRAARYRDRPAQADQLHLDLRWRGEDVACDAGSYLYGGAEPWQNGLAGTAIHNTVTISGRDQMTRAGRFLWLDWAQASVAIETRSGLKIAKALHDGYRTLGCTHQRSVAWSEHDDFWLVVDEISGRASQPCRLHWLFPDYGYEIHESSLDLKMPVGKFAVNWSSSQKLQISLARAGELVFGEGVCDETRGWRSLYYAEKIPALSLALEGQSPIRFVTVFAPAERQAGEMLNCEF